MTFDVNVTSIAIAWFSRYVQPLPRFIPNCKGFATLGWRAEGAPCGGWMAEKCVENIFSIMLNTLSNIISQQTWPLLDRRSNVGLPTMYWRLERRELLPVQQNSGVCMHCGNGRTSVKHCQGVDSMFAQPICLTRRGASKIKNRNRHNVC